MADPVIPLAEGFKIPSTRPVTATELAALVPTGKRLVLAQRCHFREGLAACYIDGRVEVVCLECGAPVITIEVGK